MEEGFWCMCLFMYFNKDIVITLVNSLCSSRDLCIAAIGHSIFFPSLRGMSSLEGACKNENFLT